MGGLSCDDGHFYPRSPCGERLSYQYVVLQVTLFLSTLSLRRATLAAVCYDYYSIGFLSTLSLRRATTAPRMPSAGPMNFYPRSPCGERPTYFDTSSMDDLISIHALLAESDPRRGVIHYLIPNFYPRSPCGERRSSKTHDRHKTTISIHALLAESDCTL